MELSRTLYEIISWNLMAELLRRHPEAGSLIETHPCDGMYDCLTLFQKETVACLNRGGSFTVFQGADARVEREHIWLPSLCENGFRKVLDAMTAALGLSLPDKLPPTTPEVLTYRIIAMLLAQNAFQKSPLNCLNGQLDTSGYGDQSEREAWFEAVSAAKQSRDAMDRSKCLMGNPRYHFWFLIRDQRLAFALSTDGMAYTKSGKAVDLMTSYRATQRLEPVAGELLCLA
jgi:hypothetical protein